MMTVDIPPDPNLVDLLVIPHGWYLDGLCEQEDGKWRAWLQWRNGQGRQQCVSDQPTAQAALDAVSKLAADAPMSGNYWKGCDWTLLLQGVKGYDK